MLVDHVCQNCGKTYKVRLADVKRGWGKTCSKSCKSQLQMKTHGDTRTRGQEDDGSFLLAPSDKMEGSVQ